MFRYSRSQSFIFYNSFIIKKVMFQTIERFSNWEKDIKPTLSSMVEKQLDPARILKQILRFKQFSYLARDKNTDFYHGNNFKTLYLLYSNELPDIFSQVAKFVLTRPKFQIPLFPQGQNKAFVFSKEKILYLYCLMVLCLIPKQQFDKNLQTQGRYNILMDFSFIFDEEEYKTRTVIEYLKKEIGNASSYKEQLVIQRSCEDRSLEAIIQENGNKPMGRPLFQQENSSIEDYYGCLKADFANRYLGGGALMTGCVQEEIMFTNHPELFTAQLLCEVMKPNECIFLSGYKKYFSNTGYGYSAAFDKAEEHIYDYDENGMAREYITAIDAQPFGWQNERKQLTRKWIDRQLLKAYVGFNFKEEGVKSVATGNWGCGAFGGDLRIKFLVQWIACSMADKQMIYCPFGSSAHIKSQQLFQRLQTLKVGEVYERLYKGGQSILDSNGDLDIYKVMG